MNRIAVDKMVRLMAGTAWEAGRGEYVAERPGPGQVREWIDAGFGAKDDGILKRLIAAIQSSGERAGLAFGATADIVRAPRVIRTSEGQIRRSTVRIVIESDGGWHSFRSYRMVAIVEVTKELFADIERYRVRSGSALVTDSRGGGDSATYFGGRTVGEWIAGVYFGKLAGRRELEWLASPEWHVNARAQLAETLRRITSGEDMADGMVALCGATHEEVIVLCSRMRKEHPTLVAAMDESPDNWSVTAGQVLCGMQHPGASLEHELADMR